MKQTFIAFVLLTLAAAASFSQAPSGMVYVSDGTTARQIPRNELTSSCDHWEIWLFRNGSSVAAYRNVSNSSAHWGTLNGKSEQSVEEQLKRDQAFDKLWDKFAAIPPHSPNDLDDENPVGPICVVPEAAASTQERLQKLDQISQNLAPLQTAAMYAWDQQPNANEELREYVRTLQIMQQTQSRMFGVLDKYLITPNLNAIDGELSELSSQLSVAQQTSTRLVPIRTHSFVAPSASLPSRVQSYQVTYPVPYRSDQSWTADWDGKGVTVYTVVTQGGQMRRFQLDVRFDDVSSVGIPTPGPAAQGWGSITLGFKTPRLQTNTATASAMALYFNTQSEAEAAYSYLSARVPGH